ncbi:MAG: transcriptional regulator [Deltaproteobacteria bacterium]|nr:transcriptional regulator [Deltaproteobacteria bacterium]
MVELLSEGAVTLQELSSEVRLPMKDVLHHLKHVQKSTRPPARFQVAPAMCLNCGFVFEDRRKLHAPSKCPKCKGTHIQDPTYRIDHTVSQSKKSRK